MKMKKHFKSHLLELKRYQTSSGRDLVNGLRLDRNEKVTNFNIETMDAIFSQFKGYSLSASPDSTTLYQRIASYLRIEEENVYITGGITEGIRILYETLTNPGENIVVLDPTYPMYYVYSKVFQVEYRKFRYNQKLKPDWDSFFEAIDENTTMVMIPNPNLPIESAFTRDEIKTIAERCADNNIALVVDEAYHYFGTPTVADMIHEYDNIVVMRTFSKAYGLAGLRIGYMISNAENINYLSKTRSLVESNTLTMGIAEYMLNHPELREKHVKEIKEGAAYLQQELTKIGIRWHGGDVTNGILIFLDNDTEPKMLEQYLREKKIYIRGSFESPYSMCVRVSLGAREIMEVFFENFKLWLQQKNAK